MVNHKQKRTRKVSRKVMRGGVGYKFNNKDVIGGRKKAIEIFNENAYSLREKISIYPKTANIFQIK